MEAPRKHGPAKVFKDETYLGIKIERKMKDLLEAKAEEEGRSVSWVVRKALEKVYKIK